MAIQSRKNQYVGVNAHLHSSMQSVNGDWSSFHAAHVIHIAEAIDRLLPPGYLVTPEKSLQIREQESGADLPAFMTRRKPKGVKPDIAIYAQNPSRQRSPAQPAALTAPTLTIEPIPELDDPDMYLTAVVIRAPSDQPGLGSAVAWLELLSPTNKPGGTGFLQYHEKRIATLKAGVVMVELDYLHESRPVSAEVPSYPDGEKNAYPYSILVTEPRPQPREGQMRVYGFQVDAAMPVLSIPLLGDDTITVDFGALYHQTFARFGFYSLLVDYEQLPERFDTYSETDQTRIRARMRAVQAAHAKGIDLEQGPFPTEDG